MKRTIFLMTAAALLAFVPANATYDSALAHCQDFAKANNTSPDTCSCIAKAIGDNEALEAEQEEVKTLDDFGSASADFKAAVNPCLPPDQRVP